MAEYFIDLPVYELKREYLEIVKTVLLEKSISNQTMLYRSLRRLSNTIS